MRSLYECLYNYIFEAKLSNKDFDKHGYAYVRALINKLINNQPIRIGNKGEDGIVSLDQLTRDEQNLAIQFEHSLDSNNYKEITIDNFNKIFKSVKLSWTNFFKGDYSGYTKGLESKNKGNAFESEFIMGYQSEGFENDIKKIVPYKELKSIHADGSLNQKRPLNISDNSILLSPCTKDNFDIGKIVTDVTLDTDKGPIYLSLKYGSSVTFCNAGIKTLFDKKFFEGGTNKKAELFCDLFCLNQDRFREVFANYIGGEGKHIRSQKESIDITKELAGNDKFMDFLKSVIGYGYILVHKNNGHIEYHDLRTEKNLDSYIGHIKKAEILYPIDGKAKRIDIVVTIDKLEIKFNIRSKDGGLFPTHLMADYNFL